MDKKDIQKLVHSNVWIDMLFMLIFSLIIMWLRLWPGVLCLIATAMIGLYHSRVSLAKTAARISAIRSDAALENDEITRNFIDSCPVYMCVTDINGKLSWSTEGFRENISTEENISQLIAPEILDKLFDQKDYKYVLKLGDKSYKVSASDRDESGYSTRMLYFDDVTESEAARESFKEQKACLAYINIDNYEELLAANPVESQGKIIADIENALREWAGSINASLVRVRSSQFIMVFGQSYIDSMRMEKFAVMDKIHAIKTEADFPTTVSVGIGINGESYAALQEDAFDAMDLALGRGGDQVVIKNANGDEEFFGGGLANVDRRNKGKARIMSHALMRLIKDSSNVLVMGHGHGDMDSFGASIGIAALAKAAGKQAAIVLNSPNESIDIIYDAALETGRFDFVEGEYTTGLARRDTLLVIVDTHIGPRVEYPELLDRCKRIVVIDHHRKAANAIENTVLTYMEPYASSACELVTEIMQYAGSDYEFERFEMSALLAGIALDTKNFTQNAGVRSFESAGWLKRQGADTKEVNKFFKMRLDFFQKKVNMIASAEMMGNGIAVAYTKENDPAMSMLTGQTADELLEMRDIRASFVAGVQGTQTTVSARSDGSINVQVIMEKMGGGGHLNIAAAQSADSPEKVIAQIVQILRDEELIER